MSGGIKPRKDYVGLCLSYDVDTGAFVWRNRPLAHFSSEGSWRSWNSKHASKVAGTINSHGYVVIRLDGGFYKAHRLAWLLATGNWPDEDIDHVNLVKSDNRFHNLRAATRAQNSANTKRRSTNKSGFKGVWFSKHHGKRVACVRKKHVGYFLTPELAHEAYVASARVTYGRFARGV